MNILCALFVGCLLAAVANKPTTARTFSISVQMKECSSVQLHESNKFEDDGQDPSISLYVSFKKRGTSGVSSKRVYSNIVYSNQDGVYNLTAGAKLRLENNLWEETPELSLNVYRFRQFGTVSPLLGDPVPIEYPATHTAWDVSKYGNLRIPSDILAFGLVLDGSKYGQCTYTLQTTATECGPGEYIQVGYCAPCLKGFVCDGWDFTLCTDGPPVDNECTACNAGQYYDRGAVTCQDCAAGYYGTGYNSTCYGECRQGYRCPKGSAEQDPCPVGMSSSNGSEFCFTCPAGSHTREKGAVCKACPAGYYSDGVMLDCQPCQEGYWGVGGSKTSTCDGKCKAGVYCPEGSTDPLGVDQESSTFEGTALICGLRNSIVDDTPVDRVVALKASFAAFRTDGSVIVWTDDGSSIPSWGVDFSEGIRKLVEVTPSSDFDYDSTTEPRHAFAAIKNDGSLVTWGDVSYGGLCPNVDSSGGIRDLVAMSVGFIGIKNDGSLFYCGEKTNVAEVPQIDPVDGIGYEFVTCIERGDACIAIKSDGSVVAWGQETLLVNYHAISAKFDKGVRSISNNEGAFAVILSDASVVTWGTPFYGGDSSGVDFSGGVESIYATSFAFAALRNDGSVVTWGKGENSNNVAATDVVSIYTNTDSFAALKHDGSIVTWGSYYDSNHVDFSGGVKSVHTSDQAFAALKNDGTIVTWGSSSSGGDSTGVDFSGGIKALGPVHGGFVALKIDGTIVRWGTLGPETMALNNVVEIYTTEQNTILVAKKKDGTFIRSSLNVHDTEQLVQVDRQVLEAGFVKIVAEDEGNAFAVLKIDGSVVSWGQRRAGGDSSQVNFSTGVRDIIPGRSCFAAIKNDGSVVTWGTTYGTIHTEVDFATGVKKLIISGGVFAAIKHNGALVTWGDQSTGGSIPVDLSGGVLDVVGNGQSLTAVKSDGTVVSWGNRYYMGDPSAITFPQGVEKIVTNSKGFAAIKKDGSVVTWGHSKMGADSSRVDFSSGVKEIVTIHRGFAALKNDGTVVSWGTNSWGDDIYKVVYDCIKVVSWGGYFLALKTDDTIVTWGSRNIESLTEGVNLTGGVRDIFSTSRGFAALQMDGSVVSWPHSSIPYLPPVRSLVAGSHSFAAIRKDGTIAMWGSIRQPVVSCGSDLDMNVGTIVSLSNSFAFYTRQLQTGSGNDRPPPNLLGILRSSAYRDQWNALDLVGEIKSVKSTQHSWAILYMDGRVVTFGMQDRAGNSSLVDFSGGVKAIYSSMSGFTAIKNDGTVVTWGGALPNSVSFQPVQGSHGFVEVFSTSHAFAALKEDGSVVAWGSRDMGGDCTGVDFSGGVKSIYSNDAAFMAIKNDGSVVTWGSPDRGGSSTHIDFSSGVRSVFNSGSAFMVVLNDSRIVTWGSKYSGGVSTGVDFSSGVKDVVATKEAFAAIKYDGSVVTWGGLHAPTGADSSSVDFSSGVQSIAATYWAFSALKMDGSVVTWGGTGGDSSGVDFSGGVRSIHSSRSAFAAIKNDGSVVSWGMPGAGGNSSGVDFSGGVQAIYSTWYSFMAVKNDGTIVTWGRSLDQNFSSVPDATMYRVYSNNADFVLALRNDIEPHFWSWGCDCSPTQAYSTCMEACRESRGESWAWTCDAPEIRRVSREELVCSD